MKQTLIYTRFLSTLCKIFYNEWGGGEVVVLQYCTRLLFFSGTPVSRLRKSSKSAGS